MYSKSVAAAFAESAARKRRFSPTRSMAQDRWNWSSGYVHSQYSHADENKEDESEKYVRISRSPVKRLVRERVAEEKRNFGDYDPVSNRTAPRSCVPRSPLPFKLKKRRVIYKGISEPEMNRRARQRNKGNAEPWRKEADKKYDEKYRRGSAQEEPFSESASPNNDGRGEEEDFSYYSRTNPPIVRLKDFSEILLSDSDEGEDSADENWDHHRRTNRGTISHDSFIVQEQLDFGHNTMSGKKWYEVAETERTQVPETEGSFMGTRRGLSEWRAPAERGESVKTYGSNRSLDTRTSLGEIGSGHFSGGSRASSILTMPSSATTPDVGQRTTSWMEYCQGSGFYSGTKTPERARIEVGSFVQNSPVSQGYVSTKGGNLETQGYDEIQEVGMNEYLFCDKICKLDYFYRLKRRPAEEKHGVKYYGFELEFWPLDDPMLKEVVFGYQMEDEQKAKDSVFAAGLLKLSNVKEKVNIGLLRLKERVYGQTSREQPGYDRKNAYTSRQGSELGPSRAASSSVHRRNDFEPLETLKEDDYENCRHQRTSANYSYESNRRSNERPMDDIDRDAEQVPKFKRDPTDNFRVAIPNGPSLIEEQMQKSRMRTRKSPYGHGY